MTAMKIAAAVIANRIVAQKTTTDATTRVRHEVTPIAGQIAPDLKLVDRMIDVVICNHRKADATAPVPLVVNRIAAQTALVLSLVDLTIAADSFRLTVAMAAAWLHDTTTEASVGKATFVRHSVDRVTIVAA